MEDFSVNDQNQMHRGSRCVSALTRVAARLTGSSIQEMTDAPDAERGAVHLAGVSLLLVSLASGFSWWIALGIARADYSIWHLPLAGLASVLVYTVDRAMMRAHWHRAGQRAAWLRGIEGAKQPNLSTTLLHGALRIALSVTISLTAASFIELEVFRQDTDAYLKSQNRAQNQPLYKAAAGRIDTQIDRTRQEIASLDDRTNSLMDGTAKSNSAAQATSRMRLQTLTNERRKLRERIRNLTTEIDCQVKNGIAEEFGGTRCDGSKASIGKGHKWKLANERRDYSLAERSRAEKRLVTVDASLALLGNSKNSLIPQAVQNQITQMSAQRVRATQHLTRLTEGRDRSIAESVAQNAAITPMPEGLIVRGEALNAMARQSPWLAGRIILITLSMVLLDLAAIFVIIIQPAPSTLALGEILATEIASTRLVARAELAIGEAKRTIHINRESTMAVEDELDRKAASMRQNKTFRNLAEDRVNKGFAKQFSQSL